MRPLARAAVWIPVMMTMLSSVFTWKGNFSCLLQCLVDFYYPAEESATYSESFKTSACLLSAFFPRLVRVFAVQIRVSLLMLRSMYVPPRAGLLNTSFQDPFALSSDQIPACLALERPLIFFQKYNFSPLKMLCVNGLRQYITFRDQLNKTKQKK